MRPRIGNEAHTNIKGFITMQLKGKIAWITGAGSGIGRAAAHALAAEGASLALTGRRRPNLDETAKNTGTDALIQDGDVTDASRVSQIAREIENVFGRLDIVVNNAGTNIVRR
jgi:NADP-dependent 3-hydroxy acid dehydrogenase YdfG